MLLVVVLAAAAVVVLAARPAGPVRLAVLWTAGRSPSGAAGPDSAPSRVGAGPACAAAGVAVGFLIHPPVGPLLGLAVALAGPGWLRRLEPRTVRERREQLARDLPLALELLAACLAGGADSVRAVEAVAAAVGGPCADRFGAVGAALRAGSAPTDAWSGLAGPSSPAGPADPLGPVARLLARTAVGGAPVADTVQRLAADVRAVRRGDAQQAARRVGVLAVAPLGLCFLPAFVLIGVVPVILGLAGPVLSGL